MSDEVVVRTRNALVKYFTDAEQALLEASSDQNVREEDKETFREQAYILEQIRESLSDKMSSGRISDIKFDTKDLGL